MEAVTVPYCDIKNFIPYTPPMLMIDRFSLDMEQRSAIGIKAVSMDEHYFQGHFPQNPIMPGVLQIAAMEQLSGALFKEIRGIDTSRNIPVVQQLCNMKFRNPVTPGDLITVETQQDPDNDALFHAKTLVGGNLVCQGSVQFQIEERAHLRQLPRTVGSSGETGRESRDTALQRHIGTIMQAIPHRYPFLLVDRILEIDQNKLHITGLKNVTGNEPFFQGTPEPLMPEAIQCEIAAQTGCILALTRKENDHKFVYFMSISEATFKHHIVPGDQVTIDMQVTERGRYGKADGTLSLDGKTASSISMKFALVEQG